MPKRENPLPGHIKTQAQLGEAMKALAVKDGQRPSLPTSKKGGARPQDHDRLTQRRAAVLAYVTSHAPVTAQEVADALGVHIDTARDDLIIHAQAGKLHRSEKMGFAGKLYWEGAGE